MRLHIATTAAIILTSAPVAAQSTGTEEIIAQPATSGSEVSTDVEPTSTAPASTWNTSSSVRGSFGVHRLDAAHPMPPWELVLTVGGTYFTDNDFLVAGDSNERRVQTLTLAFALPWGFELSLSQRSTTNNNPEFNPETTQVLGDPELGVKYSYEMMKWLGVGGLITIMLPTSPNGSGLKPGALRLGINALATAALMSWMELTLNAGFVYDNTGNLFKRSITAAQRFSADVSNSHLFTLGLGAATDFSIADVVGVGPFAEVTVGIGVSSGVQGGEHPALASLGTKVYPAGGGLLELAVGADIRINGAPDTSIALPGLPPWVVFARISAHLFATRAADSAGTARDQSCTADAGCSKGLSCFEQVCVMVRREEIIKTAETYTLEGAVVDKATGKPVRRATIQISGFDTLLAADPKTGTFKSFPMPVGQGLVQVKVQAPGFAPGEYTVSKGKAGEITNVSAQIQSLGKDQVGELKGSLKDARSGQALAKGKVFVPKLGKRIKIDENGQFQASLKPGRFQLLISSRGYKTQKKEIEILPGDVVILNVDLQPKRR